MAFDPTGHLLVVGFTTGQLKFLDAETLNDIGTSEPYETAITHIKVLNGVREGL